MLQLEFRTYSTEIIAASGEVEVGVVVTATLLKMSLRLSAFLPLVCAQMTYTNPLGPRGGDPGAAYDSLTDAYYYATTSVSAPNAYPIWKSTDLKNWTEVGAVFPGRSAWPVWVQTDMWAPEFHQLASGTWVVYFAARNHQGNLSVGVATSTTNSILGPYKDLGRELVTNSSMGNIDPSFFLDDNQHYLIYKEDGNAPQTRLPTPIWLRTLAPDGITITGPPIKMITNDPTTWELALVEAPWLVKHAGWYYLFYSGAYQAQYAVGVARAPAITGPYTKFGPPLLHTNASSVPFQGTGHCSVITDAKTGNLAMIYHSWYHGPEMIMLDAVKWNNESPPWPYVGDGSGYPSSTPQVVP